MGPFLRTCHAQPNCNPPYTLGFHRVLQEHALYLVAWTSSGTVPPHLNPPHPSTPQTALLTPVFIVFSEGSMQLSLMVEVTNLRKRAIPVGRISFDLRTKTSTPLRRIWLLPRGVKITIASCR